MTRRAASTFAHQAALPRLPVPSLEETCAAYLQTVKPLATPQEFAATSTHVAAFLAPGGPGAVLQKRLLDRRAATLDKSWLIEWWNDYAYMSYRDPVVINVNYFFAFTDDAARRVPALRAASIVTGALAFRDLVTSETLEPDTARSGPLCMEQYKYMFNSTRIPQPGSDVTRVSDPRVNNYIIVLRRNRFFKLDLAHPDGRQLSTAEFALQFEKIYAAASSSVPAIGALTTENRDVWTQTRTAHLLSNRQNAASLDVIERAAFVVCLDTSSPVTKEEISRACWHGDGRNRFFDKSMQFVVFENGRAGFNGEHSMMDATPTSRICEFICEGNDKGTFNHGSATPSSTLAEPVALTFQVTPELGKAIQAAEQQFDGVIAKHDLQVVCFEAYGKNLIKTLAVSPDAYAQMAIQLAYYKMYSVCRATYESAQTKKYAYGRTETCRSVSSESVAWVQAMQQPGMSLRERGELGRKAVAAQSAYMAKCVEGRGVDRHFLGLRLLLAPGEAKPAIFTDPLFGRSCHWNLSTSQISSEHFCGYGWGQVVPDGYGVAYMVNADRLQFNLVSLFLRNDHFREHLHQALHEMRLVFEASLPPPKPAKAKL